jgi:2-oxoglutarate ferredoxin oxidoreductase subunit beta
MLANMKPPEFPAALGVIRSVKSNTFEELVWHSLASEKENSKLKNVDQLLHTGNTWEKQ